MSLRDAYRQKLEAQLEEQRARMDLLKARAKRALAEGRIMGYEELADTEQKLAHMKASLKEFAQASDGALKEMKVGLDKAWADLSESYMKASAKFGGKDKETAFNESP